MPLTAGRTLALRPPEHEGTSGRAQRDGVGSEAASCWGLSGREEKMGCYSLRSQGSSLGVCPTFGAPTFALAAEWAWVMSRSCVGYCNSGISHSLSSPVPYRCLGLLGLASEDRFYFDSGGFPVADWLVAAIHSTDFPNCWLE